MALSDYLTRDEWNAAYFSYLVLVQCANWPWPTDLSTTLRGGIVILNQMGYRSWAGVSVTGSSLDDVHKNGSVSSCQAGGKDNSHCLVEILEGTIDYKARALETLNWLDRVVFEVLPGEETVQDDFRLALRGILLKLTNL